MSSESTSCPSSPTRVAFFLPLGGAALPKNLPTNCVREHVTTRVLVESHGDVSTLQSRATHGVQHNVALAAVDLIPRVQHALLATGAMACANGELPMRPVEVPEKERGLALYGIGRQGQLKGGDALDEILRKLTLAVQCGAQLALGEDDESGGDLEVRAEPPLDRLDGTANGDGPRSHLLRIEHGIHVLLEPGLRDEVVGRDNVGAVPLDPVDTVETFATVANKVTAPGIALIVLRSLGRSRNRVA